MIHKLKPPKEMLGHLLHLIKFPPLLPWYSRQNHLPLDKLKTSTSGILEPSPHNNTVLVSPPYFTIACPITTPYAETILGCFLTVSMSLSLSEVMVIPVD